MATGGVTNYSCCSPCLDDGRNTVARHYCVDCEMYFCTKCVKCHNKIPALKTHQVNDVDSGSTDVDDDLCAVEYGSDVRNSTCTLHQDKLIDTFCKNHNEVCCGSCALVKHRLCLTVSITIAAKEFKASPERSKCIAALNETVVKFNAEKKKRVENRDCIGKQKEKLIEAVDKKEAKLIAKIKEIANKSRNEIRAKHEEHKTALDSDIEALDVGIDTNTEYTKQFDQRDDEQQFIYVKTNKTVTKDGETLLQTMTKGWRKKELGFTFDKLWDTHILKMTSFGRLEEEFTVKSYRDRGDEDRAMDRDRRKRKFWFEEQAEEDEDRSRSNANVKELVKPVTDRYRGKTPKKEERINKKLKLKAKSDDYSECYPGTSYQNDAKMTDDRTKRSVGVKENREMSDSEELDLDIFLRWWYKK